jgi:hypothetical protein
LRRHEFGHVALCAHLALHERLRAGVGAAGKAVMSGLCGLLDDFGNAVGSEFTDAPADLVG